MNQSKLSAAKVTRFLWGAALFTLPVTSFRYFPFLGETTYVRPLAFYSIAFLLPLLFIQLWRGKLSIPRAGALTPLTVFVLFILAATIFGTLLDPLPLRGQEYAGRAIRAWATVIIGLSFFLSAVWMNRDEDDLRFTVTWLMAGFVMDVLWSGVQSLAFYTPLLEKVTVTHWQRAFSMRELVRTNRVSGMAYEPAWLAGQIVTVYLPVLFASLLTRLRATRFRWLEVALLVLAALLLLATFSRGGLLIGVVAAILTFIFAGRAELRAVWTWFISGFQRGAKWFPRVAAFATLMVALTGAGFFLSQKGYITRLFNTQAESLEEFIIKNSAGARAAYTFGALGAYQESPIIGVGLGASGLYIYDNLPDWALTTVPEIARQLSPENRLYPTPKNMYARLLAETGLFGFILYFSFLFSVLGDSLIGLQDNKLFMRYVGIAGLYSLIAIGLYNNTQDSFATPNIWLLPGVVTGIISNANYIVQTTVPSGLSSANDDSGNGQENR